jgi:hypothetical protein
MWVVCLFAWTYSSQYPKPLLLFHVEQISCDPFCEEKREIILWCNVAPSDLRRGGLDEKLVWVMGE